MATRLSTGIDVLDRRLDGGLPVGSVVAYTAPPASQSELLLFELTRPRDTLYLSTKRTEQAVKDAFERTRAPTGSPRVRYVAGDAPLENARRYFRDVEGQSNLVIDPVDVLETQDESRFRNFLNDLQNHMHNIEGLAVLHCLKGTPPPLRDTTLHMADVVFDLQMDVEGTDVETQLVVPKFRGGRALSDAIKLQLEDQVRVDTSRDIA